MENAKREYGTVEWLWEQGKLRVTRPGVPEAKREGSYAEVVAVLTGLGQEGWKVVACIGAGNWLFWTVERENG